VEVEVLEGLSLTVCTEEAEDVLVGMGDFVPITVGFTVLLAIILGVL
jgi:hypothetical protein